MLLWGVMSTRSKAKGKGQKAKMASLTLRININSENWQSGKSWRLLFSEVMRAVAVFISAFCPLPGAPKCESPTRWQGIVQILKTGLIGVKRFS
jgi:hypothetical protein